MLSRGNYPIRIHPICIYAYTFVYMHIHMYVCVCIYICTFNISCSILYLTISISLVYISWWYQSHPSMKSIPSGPSGTGVIIIWYFAHDMMLSPNGISKWYWFEQSTKWWYKWYLQILIQMVSPNLVWKNRPMNYPSSSSG